MAGPVRPALLAALLAAAAGLVPARAQEPARFRMPPLVETTLDNGLRVVVCPRPGSGLVDVRVALRVGSWLEGDHAGSGISHYFEHLVAAGTTATRTEEESRAQLRRIGGVMNAYTDADRSWFYVTTTTAGFPAALELLADWMQNCTVDAQQFERERNVILGEFDLYASQAPRRAWELLHSAAFTRHPARLPLQGERARFEALTRDEVQAFYRSHYVPGNAVVAVVGDVDAGAAANLVRERFGGWPRARPPEPELPPEPPRTGRREARAYLAGERSAVALGFRTVALDHPDVAALDVLRALLGDGRASLLQRAAADEARLTDGVSVWSRTPVLGGGLFIVLAQVAPGDEARFEEVVLAEAARLAAAPPSGEAVERVRRRILAELVFSLDDVSNLAQTLTRDVLQTGDARFQERYLRALAAVEPADVERVAARYLVPERLTVAVVGPGLAAAEGVEGAPRDAVASDFAAAAPAAGEAAPRPREWRLANGLLVRLEPRPGAGGAGLFLAAPVGAALGDAAPARAQVLAELFARGGRPEVETRLAALEARGAQLGTMADRQVFGVGLRVLEPEVREALEYLASAFAAPSFSETAVGVERARVLAAGAARRGDFQAAADDRLHAAAFAGAGGVEAPLAARPEDAAALDRDALVERARAVATGPSLCLGIAGQIDEAALRPWLEETLGRLPGGAPPEAPPHAEFRAPSEADGPLVYDVERGHAALLLAWPGAAVEDLERRVGLDLLDAWLSGRRIASGPLYRALRGDRDLAYFVAGGHRAHRGCGIVHFHVEFQPADLPEVRAALASVVRGAIEEGPAPEDLEQARNVLLLSRRTVRQDLAVAARSVAMAGVFGLPADHESRYSAAVRDYDLDGLRAVARGVLEGRALEVLLWPKGVPRP